MANCNGNIKSIMTLRTVKSDEMKFYMAGYGTFTIDWGDGIVESGTLWEYNEAINYDKSRYVHKYTNRFTGSITITGDNITYLDCTNNLLENLDVSKNATLIYLNCYGNLLTSLDVSKNTELTVLWCNNNLLTSLDVSKNTKLKELYCYRNQLISLNLSENAVLVWLMCSYNQLTSLDVSKNTQLAVLMCNYNKLSSYALNILFGTLHSNAGIDTQFGKDKKEIFIENNPGAESSDQSIAIDKGWDVNPRR